MQIQFPKTDRNKEARPANEEPHSREPTKHSKILRTGILNADQVSWTQLTQGAFIQISNAPTKSSYKTGKLFDLGCVHKAKTTQS